MKIAIAHHVPSFQALDQQLDYTSISPDPEDYYRCIARERTQEMEICREMDVPCFLIIDTPETQGIRMIGHGYQNPFRQHLLFDSQRKPVKSLAGYEILLRASGGFEQSLLAFIEAQSGKNIADWPSQVLTRAWYKHVKPEFLKRQIGWFRMDEVFSHDLSRFKINGRFFCKTNYKTQDYAGITNDLVTFLGYQTEVMPLDTEVIISEPLEIPKDVRGKLEFRCYIVRGIVSSISRHLDYDTDYLIPASVSAFAEAFVQAHKDILPPCYILDIAESKRGIVVIELNGIVASGRYERNDFRKLLADLKSR